MTTQTTTTRTCNTCGETLPIESFYKTRGTYRAYICKNCHRAKARERNARRGQYLLLSTARSVHFRQVFAGDPEAQAVISDYLNALIRFDDVAVECGVKPDVGEFMREYTGRRSYGR